MANKKMLQIAGGALVALGAAVGVFKLTATPGTTYYVLQGGGSRYSSAVPSGQCNATANVTYAVALAAAPAGQTTNLNCALGEYRYAFDDQSYNSYSGTGWVFKSGDTLVVGPGQWAVGYDAPPGSCSGTGCGAGWTWCDGGQGGCQNPPIPAGTAAQHTRILAACALTNNCTQANMTQLYGRYGIGTPLDLSGAQFVDVIGFEITRHSNCIWFGVPTVPSGCSNQNPGADFDSDGIHTNNQTHDVLLQDMWIHGHTGRGIKGPIGAGPVTCERCDIAYNGAAGWDFDDGNATPIPAGAVWNFLDSVIEFSGCNQDYPNQGQAISCYGQSNGGYGDGVGTPAGTGLNVNVNNSIFRNNTQDGIDLGHIDTGGPYTIAIINSQAYGNNGGQFKWGGQVKSVDFENNMAIANCLRMSAPLTGQPATYNANLGDFCRAEDGVSFNFIQGTQVIFKHNTIVGYAPTLFDMQCWAVAPSTCNTASLDFENNIVLGYDNPGTYNLGGKVGGPGGFFVSSGALPPPILKNNTWYGVHGYVCAATETCASPQFVNQPVFTKESDLDNFNIALASGSPSIGQGATSSVIVPPPPVVTPVVPTITWKTPNSVSTGTILSTNQLNATASTSGKFVYSPAVGTILATAGTTTLSTTFTPTDTTNFAVAKASVSLTITASSKPASVTCTTPLTVTLTPNTSGAFTISTSGCK